MLNQITQRPRISSFTWKQNLVTEKENTDALETFCCSNKHEKVLKIIGLKILMQKTSLKLN